MKKIAHYLLGLARSFWQWLTKMRTALILLFLLALGAIPGALLPQRSLNETQTQEFIANNGKAAQIMDRLQFFDVFDSTWFVAIYLLLFISLIGCIIPRAWDQYKAIRGPLPAAPTNLARMPQYLSWKLEGESLEQLQDDARHEFSRWKTTETPASDDRTGNWSLTAEKGVMREVANLCFHLGLVFMLVSIALGKLFSYEGQAIVIADGDNSEFCNTAVANFDSFRAGRLVDGTKLKPFCLTVDQFRADYASNGQAEDFQADIHYTSGEDIYSDSSSWPEHTLKVNHPLDYEGNMIYLQGHGYAPTFTVTWPDGEKRTETVQFRPEEQMTFLSSGVVQMDPPAGMYPDDYERRNNQIAIQGLFAPTAEFSGDNDALLSSSYPGMLDPAVAVDIYKGDTGLDSGRSQNIFSLNMSQVENGKLQKQQRVNLTQGQSTTLEDGTVITFEGAKEFVNLQISHSPTDLAVLGSTVFMIVCLAGSLIIKRRRIWVRLVSQGTSSSASSDTADPTDTIVEVQIAGRASTDSAGWDSEFLRIAERLLDLEEETLSESSALE